MEVDSRVTILIMEQKYNSNQVTNCQMSKSHIYYNDQQFEDKIKGVQYRSYVDLYMI
jgi:hypothetical protein